MKKKVLFVGNSYTYYNEMPAQIFEPMAEDAGCPCEVTAVTRGGYRLEQFADPENEEGKRLREVIAGKHYDYVVLQNQSCQPITEPEAFEAGVAGLKELLQEQAEYFVLYATWGRKPGCEMLEQLGMSSEEMTAQLDAAYTKAGERFGMQVAHVGLAFEAYLQEHPDAELYNPDKSHPSVLGSEIAARTILEEILRGIAPRF